MHSDEISDDAGMVADSEMNNSDVSIITDSFRPADLA
jgi:hypothetical protein